MEENREFLNEEKYKKAETMVTFVAILIFLIGFGFGGYLIYSGTVKPSESELETLKVELENKKAELEAEGVSFTNFASYSDGKVYDLMIVSNAINPKFNYCKFDEYLNNSITKEYCSLKNKFEAGYGEEKIIIGIAVIFLTLMIGGFTMIIAKRRKIMAFSMQQTIPVVQEGIEKMAPTIRHASKDFAEGIKDGTDFDIK